MLVIISLSPCLMTSSVSSSSSPARYISCSPFAALPPLRNWWWGAKFLLSQSLSLIRSRERLCCNSLVLVLRIFLLCLLTDDICWLPPSLLGSNRLSCWATAGAFSDTLLLLMEALLGAKDWTEETGGLVTSEDDHHWPWMLLPGGGHTRRGLGPMLWLEGPLPEAVDSMGAGEEFPSSERDTRLMSSLPCRGGLLTVLVSHAERIR